MLRVAAYCRVSTSQEDQRNSLENQRRYFSEYISRQPDWELVEVYADEGLSGTSSDRPAFRRMLTAAAEGQLDLILTKEVSRFARNTVDALAYTRLLRRQGVGIVFLSDNIDTRQNDGEFRLTIMASVAQEESRKISERVKWGQQRSMEHGVVFGCNNIYGFTLQGGELTVKPEQAAVVREVYRRFLMDGKGTYIIARELTAEGIPPPSGKGKSWSSTMVLRLLRNEKYCGDLLQRKSCTPDFLDHRKVKNEGQSPQVYLRNHHEAIVPRAVFEAIQRELDRRQATRKVGSRPSARYWCSGKLVCGLCGNRFVPRRGAQADGGLRWVCGKRVQYGVAACAASAVGNRILLDCMKQITQDLPIGIEVILRQTLRAIPDLTRTERQQFCTILRKKLHSESVYSALLDHITVTGDGLAVHLHGVSEPLHFDLLGREKPSVQRTDG
ncbi:MAG: recombinase family protein [Agathobaculum butyriciproducens]|nr:recombinase family protein [Agathobaculum butyriciproducens]